MREQVGEHCSRQLFDASNERAACSRPATRLLELAREKASAQLAETSREAHCWLLVIAILLHNSIEPLGVHEGDIERMQGSAVRCSRIETGTA